MKRLLIISLLLMALSLSCRKESGYLPALERAESLMFVDPDSSLTILNGLEAEGGMEGEERARFALLMTQARSRNYIMPENDSLIRTAVDYYSRHGNDRRRLAWSYVYLSNVNHDLANDSIAIKYIQMAYNQLDGVNDTILHYYVEYFWGNMLSGKHPYDECIPHLTKAYDYAKVMGRPDWVLSCLNEIGDAYINIKEYDGARKYLFEALGRLPEDSTNRYTAMVNGRIALSYFAQNKHDLALSYVNKAIVAIPDINNYGTSSSIYALKGSILSKIGLIDSSQIYVNVEYTGTNPSLKLIYEKDMAVLEKGRGNYRKAVEHLEKYAELKDSLEDIKLADKVAELDKRYNLLELQAAKQAAEIKSRNLALMLVATAFAAFLVSVYAVWAYRRRKRMYDRALSAREALAQDAIESIHRAANERLLNERSVSDSLRREMLELDTVIAKIRDIGHMSENTRIKSSKDLMLTDDEQAHLVEVVDKCFNGFISRMRDEYPELNHNDVMLCCLVKLEVPNSDMALLLGLSKDALKKRKYRFKTDVLHIADPAVHVDRWIIEKRY